MLLNMETLIKTEYYYNILMELLKHINSSIIDEMPSRKKCYFETEDIMRGIIELAIVMETNNIIDYVPTDTIKAVIDWIGAQNWEDSYYLVKTLCLDVVVDFLDDALFELYKSLYGLL